MYPDLRLAINTMLTKINDILFDNPPSVYLYGSCAIGDFRLGWSDIDILVLTPNLYTEQQAEKLVLLRQAMLKDDPENPYYRSFEGGMLSLNAFKHNTPDRVIYWGTGGQKIKSTYNFNSLCMKELVDFGILLSGVEIRNELISPTYEELKADIRSHYETIRKYAVKTKRSIYSYGWLLDISRCIYTLKTGKIISKTGAAEWAVAENICPVKDALQKALEVRKQPMVFEKDVTIQNYAENLGYEIQKYADVLEQYLQ